MREHLKSILLSGLMIMVETEAHAVTTALGKPVESMVQVRRGKQVPFQIQRPVRLRIQMRSPCTFDLLPLPPMRCFFNSP
jgi:hypothetical protein